MISVLILTLNEEENLPACLESVKWSDDIVVFDSYSTDRTVEIAEAFGARVIQRKFDNEQAHRTASLAVEFRHEWVFNPDADEICTPELREEMKAAVVGASSATVGFRMRFKTMFFGKWIKFCSLYPTWVVRLFKPSHLKFERSINLRYVLDGETRDLRNHFLHQTFNNGIPAWIDKHNRYSTAEATESLKSIAGERVDWAGLVAADPVRRRRALKGLSFRLPCRPTLRFVYMYFLRLGFLDGYAGYTYCRLLAMYEYMIVLKMREIQRREKGLPI